MAGEGEAVKQAPALSQRHKQVTNPKLLKAALRLRFMKTEADGQRTPGIADPQAKSAASPGARGADLQKQCAGARVPPTDICPHGTTPVPRMDAQLSIDTRAMAASQRKPLSLKL